MLGVASRERGRKTMKPFVVVVVVVDGDDDEEKEDEEEYSTTACHDRFFRILYVGFMYRAKPMEEIGISDLECSPPPQHVNLKYKKTATSVGPGSCRGHNVLYCWMWL